MTRRINSLTAIRIFAVIGIALYTSSAAVVFLRPDLIELRAQRWLVARVAQGAAAALGRTDDAARFVLPQRLSGPLSERVDSLTAITEARVTAELAARLASVCHYCPSGKGTEGDGVADGQSNRTASAGTFQTVTAHALARYSATVRGLIRDLRIFTTTNAAVFLLVFAASFLVAADNRRVPTVALWLLLAAPLVGTAGYVFAQNWFYTVMTGRFVGFGYALWVIAIFLVLADWGMNRARVSQAIADIVGGAFKAAP
jgi:hypothetical protein